ncbi:MCE family protein [Acidiferrimicrobium sp. IK]|uniref:MCE family protein n=1 Tax=Acidiferrimicrobium sp. IK TaxID=2871700 RepID=UPI0021CB34A2|nr:MCE family protein [Acidiferrimicrobium sp. IK]MCU4186677.1 MCE family protein [Acidiferrimicrobium sp. IK]
MTKPFRERNLKVIAVVAAAVILCAVLGALNFAKLPFSHEDRYYAELANANQLSKGEYVTIAGVKIGTIAGEALEGNYVRLSFDVDPGTHLGTGTTLQVKVLSPLGQEYVQLTPKGSGTMRPGQVIPLTRTFGSPTVVSTLSQLGGEAGQIDQQQLAKAMAVASGDLAGTDPAATAAVIHGLGSLSNVISQRQSQLVDLVNQAQAVVANLNAHQAPLVTLIGQSTLVLQVVEQRRAAIDGLLSSTQTLSREISSIVTDRHANLGALLGNLQAVSAVLAKDANSLGAAVPALAGFSKYLANATGNGPYFDAVAPALFLTDSVIAQCDKPGAVTNSSPVSPTVNGCAA